MPMNLPRHLSARELYKLLASHLAHSYGISKSCYNDSELIDHLSTHWEITRASAIKNRVWTNVIASIYESPETLEKFGVSVKKDIALEYLKHRTQAERDKKQLREIDNKTGPGHKLVLIKGATRLYDDLYPSGYHRFGSDIDLYFEDISIIKNVTELGYNTMDGADGDIANFDAAFLVDNRIFNHHIPPLVCDKYTKRIELHQLLVQTYVSVKMRNCALDDVIPIPGTRSLCTLGKLDQLILLIIHFQLADTNAFFRNSRLRGFIESCLLYQNLNELERHAFNQHFKDEGVENKIRFWKYACYRLLSVREFSNLECAGLRLKYQWFLYVSHLGIAHTINHLFHSTRLLVLHRVWDQWERRSLITRFKDSRRWRRFLSSAAFRKP